MNALKMVFVVIGLLGCSGVFADARGSTEFSGGDAWVCRDRRGRIQWVQMLDTFEAGERGLLPSRIFSGVERERVNHALRYLRMIRPGIGLGFEAVLQSIHYLENHPPQVIQTSSSLGAATDSNHWIRPDTVRCPRPGRVGADPERVVLFRGDGTLQVQQELYGALSVEDRVALILHAAIYADRRARQGDTDSVLTRRIVGQVISTAPEEVREWGPPGNYSERITQELNAIYGGWDVRSEGRQYVGIPAGTFLMGSPPSEAGAPSLEGMHWATINEPFEMQTTELTWGQWHEVMGGDAGARSSYPVEVRSVSLGRDYAPEYRTEGGPPERWIVGTEDVRRFITRLNEREPEFLYRLPTEEEWEYAARAGSEMPFPFSPRLTAIDLLRYVYVQTSGFRLDRVASVRLPNAWGLYDMIGNAGELTSSPCSLYPGDQWPSSESRLRGLQAGGWGRTDGGSFVARDLHRVTDHEIRSIVGAGSIDLNRFTPLELNGMRVANRYCVITSGARPSGYGPANTNPLGFRLVRTPR